MKLIRRDQKKARQAAKEELTKEGFVYKKVYLILIFALYYRGEHFDDHIIPLQLLLLCLKSIYNLLNLMKLLLKHNMRATQIEMTMWK